MNDRHRGYLDAGALLHKCLPILGRAMAWLKRRLG
ncbi:transcriptional regulator [Pseudomonas sp. PDM28]|nr:transcriptional regulator [Pseudomonas sp. PDM28]